MRQTELVRGPLISLAKTDPVGVPISECAHKRFILVEFNAALWVAVVFRGSDEALDRRIEFRPRELVRPVAPKISWCVTSSGISPNTIGRLKYAPVYYRYRSYTQRRRLTVHTPNGNINADTIPDVDDVTMCIEDELRGYIEEGFYDDD